MSYESRKYCNADLYANIAYVKWLYGNYNRMDVSIAQCSF